LVAGEIDNKLNTMAELDSGSEKNPEEYISLFQASKLCSYSEPYLRLRARQGKFKSIKFGKKWMTTAQWVKDYVKKTKEWNERMAAKKKSVLKKENNALDSETCLSKAEERRVSFSPPAELPSILPKEEAKQATNKKEIQSNQALDLALILGSGLIFAGLIVFAVATDETFLNPASRIPQSGQASLDNIVDRPEDEYADLPDFVCPNFSSTAENGQELLSSSASEADMDPLKRFLMKAVVAINNFKLPWEIR
jgi:hypothetical protein